MTRRDARRRKQVHEAVGKWVIMGGQACLILFACYSMFVVAMAL